MDIFGIKSMLTLALVAVIMVAMAVCFRNCRKILHPTPPRTHAWRTTYGYIVEVQGGTSLTLKLGDRRRQRSIPVRVVGVTIPASDAEGDKWLARSTEKAKRLMPEDSLVCVLTQGRKKILRGEEGDPDNPDGEDGESLHSEVRRNGPLVGLVRTQAGADVGLELIKAGLAIVDPLAQDPDGKFLLEYTKAEKTAKKDKVGLWGEAK